MCGCSWWGWVINNSISSTPSLKCLQDSKMECQIGNSVIISINREVNSGGKKLEVMVVIKL